MTRSSFAGAWLVCAGALCAQDPTHDVVTELGSAEPLVVATAARAAHARSDPAAAPALVEALIEALRSWRGRASPDGVHVRLLLLDALIARRAKVPADDLVRLLDDPRLGNAALVLLAREIATNERALLAWLLDRRWRTAGDWRPVDARAWAVGDLLAARGAPGLAATIVRDADFALHVRVRDVSRTRGTDCAPRRAPAVAPLGPWPRYTLWLADPTQDATTAEWLGGIHAGRHVGVRRLLIPHSEPSPSWCVEDRVNTSRPWLGWLDVLAGTAESAERVPNELTVYFVGDPGDYVREVTAANERLEAHRARVRQGLVATGALTRVEAAAVPTTSIPPHILDQRRHRSTPLPPLPEPTARRRR